MKSNMSLLSWNIRCQGGKFPIHKVVLETTLKQNKDINIFTEFTNNNSQDFIQDLWSNGYIPCGSDKSYSPGHNDVLIAIKKEIISENTSLNIDWFDESLDYPNFLKVTLKDDDLTLHIIGVRVRIGGGGIEDCKYRKKPIDNLLSYLKTLEGRIILSGDFNNLKHNDSDTIETYKNKNLVREFYSYPILKQEFNNNDFTLITPKHGISWYGGHFVQCRLDHIIGKNVYISNEEYDWSFLKSVGKYKANEKKMDGSFGPDHAILLADILTKE